jgi:carbon monoxide dehydrogenase subunit G
MEMTGEYRIPAPRERVWQALNDPDILKQAIPGCEELVKKSDTEFEARVMAKVGPVKARFDGAVTLADLEPPESYTIAGEGKGGAAGFARGSAKVWLVEDGDRATILRYEAKADVGGKLAQIGSRLIQGTAKKMADEFFGTFSQIVAAREAPAAPPAEAAPAPAAAPAAEAVRPAPPAPPSGPEWAQKPWVWLLAIAVVVAILALILAPD